MAFDISVYEDKMEKSLTNLQEEYSVIRAGRANPRILDKIMVDYYGTPSSLQSVANISVPEARMIQIQPWESSLIKDIEKAILSSDLGLTPANDGKVAVRNIRRDANDAVKKELKANEISEDEQKQMEDKIQKLTDKYVTEIDQAINNKSDEVMTV